MDANEKDQTYTEFREVVNIAPKELETWLDSDASKAVGSKPDGGESVGHESGRRIVQIRRTNKDDLTDAEYDHMRKVIGYVRRHLAQRPSGDVRDTPWRHSLMNWGHDPIADD